MPDPTTRRIAELYSLVLHVGQVADSDDFFVLGGNSLLAMDLLDAIDEALGVKLPPRVLYRATVVAELAREVDALISQPVEGA